MQEGWPLREWAHILAPLLTGEAQKVYFALPEEEVVDYHSLKTEMLARCGLSSTRATAELHHWTYQTGKEPCSVSPGSGCNQNN